MKRKLYCKEKMAADFEAINKYKLKKENLLVEIIEDGIVYPCYSSPEEKERTYGCVLDNNLKPLELSFTFHSDFQNKTIICGEAPPPSLESIDFIDEEVVWLGYAWDFYGHFLSDSLGRLWYLINNKNMKVCYISSSDNTFLDFYTLFGLKNEQIIRITKPTRFKKIFVPEPAFRYHDYYHEKFKDILNEITKDITPAKFKKVYLSRNKFNPEVPTLGEKVIEQAFVEQGFNVVYPETLSLEKKISIMKGAEVVAGTTGTNMHNIMFCRDGIKSICLNRSADVIYMQLLIDEMKNLDAVYVDVYHTPLPISYYSQPYLLGITEELLNFFKDSNFDFKYKIKGGKYKFKPEIYEDFSKDLCQWLFSWAEVNSRRPELLPDTLNTSEVIGMIKQIWKIYDINKIIKRKKNIKEKIIKIFKK